MRLRRGANADVRQNTNVLLANRDIRWYRFAMNHDEARVFALAWVRAWNSRDLEAILSHFSDDVTFSSPLARTIIPESGGIILGKSALRDYWREGLRRVPNLHFEIDAVYLGIEGIVINYRNQDDRRICEVLFFDGAHVTRGLGTYLDDAASAVVVTTS